MAVRTSSVYVADRRIYLDADGKVVEANDPNRASLLVAENGTLPIARAQELGLVQDEAPAADADSQDVIDNSGDKADGAKTKAQKPASNKAVKPEDTENK